jgi:thiol-disulfide isomerase/thioredoxin
MLKSLVSVFSTNGGDERPSRGVPLRPFGVVVVGTLLLAACSSAVAHSDPSNGVESALPLDFEISAYQGEGVLGGQDVNLSDVLARGKPVVLNFWAGLCPPCRLEMPDLQAVYDEFGDQIVLLGLDVGPFTSLGSREEGQALLRELGITYPSGTTFDAQVVREYQITGMPSTFFVAPNGEVVRKWTGILTEAKLSELVRELIEASGGS